MRIVNKSEVYFVESGEEGFLLNTEKEIYFGLNKTAAIIWKLIEEQNDISITTIVNNLAEVSQNDTEEIHQMVDSLIKELLEKKLIEIKQ